MTWTRARGWTVAGVGTLTAAVWYTVGTYHPLPPGHQPVDGRGLFAMLLITPAAALGGLFLLFGVESAVGRLGPVGGSVAALVACAAGITLPVCYLLFFADPHVSDALSSYTDSYTFAAVIAVVVGVIRSARIALSAAADYRAGM